MLQRSKVVSCYLSVLPFVEDKLDTSLGPAPQNQGTIEKMETEHCALHTLQHTRKRQLGQDKEI